MRQLKSSNYYAGQRRNYPELPEEYRRKVNSEAMQDFPSLENTHSTLSDRAIAARLQDPSNVAALEAPQPATQLLIPSGESSSEAIEIELSQLLLSHRVGRRRRW
jgi:hypothetical protein